MKRSCFFFVIALVGAGCGGEPKPLPPATTPEASRAALIAAFDAWKQGATYDQLSTQSPPVYLQDDDFTRGRRLIAYEIEGEPKMIGIGMSYVVVLTFADGPKPNRRLAYRVVTDPHTSVSREDRSP